MSQPRIRQATLTLPVSKLLPENPLPRFADPADRPLLDGGLLPQEKEGFAQGTGLRVLPYRMQDQYAPVTETQTIPVIILENERFGATFLPGYGGRLYSLWDRQKGRECLYRNSEIVIRNLALRNAWFSGGIEWNFGHFGHTYLTCQDIFFAACTDEGGEPFLRMYEFERCKQVTFQVDFSLPAGSDVLTAHMRLENRLSADAPIFLWTNTALPQEPGMRVYSGTTEVIAEHLDPAPGRSCFYHSQLPHLGIRGLDASDPSTIPFSCEYFYQNDPEPQAAFEAVRYADGRFFAERSTANYPYRKVFAWGTHAGGQRWQQLLAGQGAGAYLEVQAGLARTQVHPSSIAANSVLHITQQFTYADLDLPEGDYGQTSKHAQAAVERLMPAAALQAAHERCAVLSTQKADRLLHAGYGWGALEACRDPEALPPHLAFPSSTLTEEQGPWLSLLQGREMESCDSFMVASPWKSLMERAEKKSAVTWNQLGVAYMEHGQLAQAKEAWEQSLRMGATPLAYRNLACLAWRRSQPAEAIRLMREALRGLSGAAAIRPYAIEFLGMLTDAGHCADAFAYYRSLPQALQSEERMRLAVMKSAYELQEDDFLQELFALNLTVVKESETLVHDIWFLYEARRNACAPGASRAGAAPLPAHLDFRMANPAIRKE